MNISVTTYSVSNVNKQNVHSMHSCVAQKEATIVIFVIFLIGCIAWLFQRAKQRNNERLCKSVARQQPLASPEQIRRGREHTNGHWFSQTQPFHVHVYSAFYDSRRTLRSKPQLAVIAVIDRRLVQRSLWCHVRYSAADEAVLLRAYPVPMGAGKMTSDGSTLVEQIIICPVTTDECLPESVALAWGWSNDEVTTFRVPVELAQNASERQSLAVCVSASFGKVDPRQLVEWLGMQHILGVQTVVIYNHSLLLPSGKSYPTTFQFQLLLQFLNVQF